MGNEGLAADVLIAYHEALMALKSGGRLQLEAGFEAHLERLMAGFAPHDPLVADVLSALLTLTAARAMYAGKLSEALRVLRTSPARDPRSPIMVRTASAIPLASSHERDDSDLHPDTPPACAAI